MGLTGKWTMVCDCGCDAKVEVERHPEDESSDDGGIGTSFSDEWGPGIPDGWIQLAHDPITGRRYLFFSNVKCLEKWLRSQGRLKEAKKLKNAIWMA